MPYRDEMAAIERRLTDREAELAVVRAEQARLAERRDQLESDIAAAYVALDRCRVQHEPWRERYRGGVPIAGVVALIAWFLTAAGDGYRSQRGPPPAHALRRDCAVVTLIGTAPDVRYWCGRAIASTLADEPAMFEPWLTRQAADGPISMGAEWLDEDHVRVTWTRQLGSPEPGATRTDIFYRGPEGFWDPLDGYD